MSAAAGGVYLPIVTPFRGGEIDLASYRRLVDHYVAVGIDGLVPLGTTGEGSTVEEREAHGIIEVTLELAGELPV